ncbi:MAG: hypothetical protein KatS3mg087_2049 [Patescibacteria group bacterium]|nr:MAG: hypothetical protein KatS3mg087_2049 [Patescibacteria group bacterium]
MNSRKDFGVLYGQKTTDDALLIYSSYEDSKASPQIGDFIVLTPRDEDGIKFLARVEAEVYDEDPIFRGQDKTLVAVHFARIAERELSERDKQKIFSYTYNVRILGTFTGDGKDFTTAVRKLPNVGYHARFLTPREINNILNRNNVNGIPIGYLCVGEDIKTFDGERNEQKIKAEILFDIMRLKNSRTMIFAQSGYGKTNLTKVLVYHLMGKKDFGKLIFDLNGEYFLEGTSTIGLGDIEHQIVRENLVVYTDRKVPSKYEGRFTNGGKVLLDMVSNLTVGDILRFGTGFTEVMQSFLLYLDDEGVGNFIQKINEYANNPEKLHQDYSDFFGKTKPDASARKTIMGIKKRISHLIEEGKGLHSSQSSLINDVLNHLNEGKTVIIDLSLKDSVDASIISSILVRELFDHNKKHFTSGNAKNIINTVIFIEEAQNVLSNELVKSNVNPFVRLAKEGRKFGLGLVAVTQRPSAISEEIRTQADNFFVFHMGNTDDIKALVQSNINYDGVISKFIQRETIRGNLYLVSSDQPFVLPVRVIRFEDLISKQAKP